MSRMENREVMGFFAIDPKHHEAILSLVAPVTLAHRLLDPYAGEGEFLEVAARAWNVTPYANELDGDRAAKCIERFGVKQAVRCDVERLIASNNAFSIGWYNPPYDHDAAASGNKRVEFRYLRHSWKWIQDGGLVLWCVYRTHLTEERCYSSQIAALPAPACTPRYRTRSRNKDTSSRPCNRGQICDPARSAGHSGWRYLPSASAERL